MATSAASSSGRLEALRDPLDSGEGKVHPQANTDGDGCFRKFDDPEKNFKPTNQKKREFYTIVLHSICATCGKDLTDLGNFPFNLTIWSQFPHDCL